MLALVPLLVPVATAAVTAIAMLILLIAIDEWWLPQQPDSTTPRFHYFTRFVKWSRQKLSDALRSARKKLASALSHAVAARSHAAVVALNNMTELTLRTAGTLADQAQQIHAALHYLRHSTIPALINVAVGPVRDIALTARALAIAATTTLTQVSVAFADGLRALPWGVPAGLPQRVATFFGTYKRLWDQVWDLLTPRVNQLWTQIVPELRARIEALERGVGGPLGQVIARLRQRVDDLERQAANIILPRIAALELAVETLVAEMIGDISAGILALTTRILELERQVATVIEARFAALELLVAEIRAELEQGIAEGLDRFGEHILELERQVTVVIPQRLAALELAVQALVDAALGDIGAAVLALTTRIVALETWVFGELRDMIDLAIGRIEALELDIRDNILPRLRAIEDLLAPAAFAAAIIAALRIALPQLFCRNVTDTASRVCAQDEALWGELIAGTMIFALALNPREVAEAGGALTGILGGVIAETVNH